MSDIGRKFNKDSEGNPVPPNTYLRGSKLGLVYYVYYRVGGHTKTRNTYIHESEPNARQRVADLARKYVLTARANEYAKLAQEVVPVEPVKKPKIYERRLGYLLAAYESRRVLDPNLSKTDIPSLRIRVRHLREHFGESQFADEITPRQLIEYVESRRCDETHLDNHTRDATIKKEIGTLKHAIKLAVEDGRLTNKLPTFTMRWRNEAHQEGMAAKTRDEELIDAFFNNLPEQLRFFCRFVHRYSGFRSAELYAMRPSWICKDPVRGPHIVLPEDLQNPYGPKDKHFKVLSQDAYVELQMYIDKHPYMRETDALMFSPAGVRGAMQRASKQAGAGNVTLRDLRAEYGLRAYHESGKDMVATADALRQSNVHYTPRYLRMTDRERRRLAEAVSTQPALPGVIEEVEND